jgi:AcrR family transcriptional regulator
MSRRPDLGARERILEAATGLFYRRGINSVGMQEVIDTCGCGKNLLYREFDGKDALVEAYLTRLEGQWQAVLRQALDLHDGDPAAQLLAVVGAAAAEVTKPDYRGCAFLNALAEVAAPETRSHQVALGHVQSMRALYERLATEARLPAPSKVADRLVLITNGMHTSALVLGPEAAIAAGVALARAVALR